MIQANRTDWSRKTHMRTNVDPKEHDWPGTLMVVLIAAGIAMIGGGLMTGCDPAATAKRAGQAVVDCAKASAPALGALVDEFKVLLAGQQPDWEAVKARAIAAGVTIGGCALAIVVAGDETEVRTSSRSSSSSLVDSAAQGRAVLEEYRRAYAGGAAFKLPSGEMR